MDYGAIRVRYATNLQPEQSLESNTTEPRTAARWISAAAVMALPWNLSCPQPSGARCPRSALPPAIGTRPVPRDRSAGKRQAAAGITPSRREEEHMHGMSATYRDAEYR